MRDQQSRLRPEVTVVNNPAKRMAGQLMDRWVTVFGAGVLAPVARRWKGQLNELAKAWGQFDFLPEGDHNTLSGVMFPQEQLPRMVALFLRGPADHPRHRLRLDLTRKAFMLEGIGQISSTHRVIRLWLTSGLRYFWRIYCFLSGNGICIDPTPIETIHAFKREMEQQARDNSPIINPKALLPPHLRGNAAPSQPEPVRPVEPTPKVLRQTTQVPDRLPPLPA